MIGWDKDQTSQRRKAYTHTQIIIDEDQWWVNAPQYKLAMI